MNTYSATIFWTLFVLMILATIHLGCQKSENDIIPRIPDQTYQFADSLIVGDSVGMRIHKRNQLIKNYPITINIDGDESDDFRLENIDYLSASHGSSIVMYVFALHDSAQVLVESFIDTSYLLEKRDTVIQGDTTYYYFENHYSCRRESEDYRIRWTSPRSKIRDVDSTDILEKMDANWNSDTLRINGSAKPGHWHDKDELPNKIFITNEHYINDCHYFLENEIHYIPFKIVGPNQMGWFKVRILKYYSFELIEYAVQKPLDGD